MLVTTSNKYPLTSYIYLYTSPVIITDLYLNHFYGFNETIKKSYMLQTAPCEYALQEALSFSSVIDFSSEKYIIFTRHRYSWYQQMKIGEVQGALSHLIYRGFIQDSNFCPKCIVKFLPKDQKVSKKGYKFLTMDTSFAQISEGCLH